jgi:hypothetical protein
MAKSFKNRQRNVRQAVGKRHSRGKKPLLSQRGRFASIMMKN